MPQKGERFRFDLQEIGGAFGDLGTLLPLTLACIAVAGLAPAPVLLGFALFYVATALHYRLPIAVQPMKAVAAVLLTTQIAPETLALSGIMLGLILLVLGLTGWIDRLGRLVPQSVLAGLQLGLGLGLALVSLDLLATAPVLGLVTLAVLAVLLVRPYVPAALAAVLLAAALGYLLDAPGMALPTGPEGAWWALPALGLSVARIEQAGALLVLPQLALTLTNAVLLTALVAGDCFGERARHVTLRRLSLTSGLGNLLLTPFGALPMCHGAGGVTAHHRFGARSGGAPLLLGAALLVLALAPGGVGLAVLATLPLAGLGALLLVAAVELAFSRRLVDSRPSCWPMIAVTAAATLWLDPFWGLVAGSLAEVVRRFVMARLRIGT